MVISVLWKVLFFAAKGNSRVLFSLVAVPVMPVPFMPLPWCPSHCAPPSQEYLLQFQALWEELQGKKVGVFAITAEEAPAADKMMKEHNLSFEVGIVL